MWFHSMFSSRVEYFQSLKYSPSSLRNTFLRLNWISVFLKQPWSNTRSTLGVIWENNLENFEKLFSMIQSRCSIYNHFLKPLHWNIRELWHLALIVMKITAEDFEKLVKSPHFLLFTSVNWLVLKIRLCFDTWCRVLWE